MYQFSHLKICNLTYLSDIFYLLGTIVFVARGENEKANEKAYDICFARVVK